KAGPRASEHLTATEWKHAEIPRSDLAGCVDRGLETGSELADTISSNYAKTNPKPVSNPRSNPLLVFNQRTWIHSSTTGLASIAARGRGPTSSLESGWPRRRRGNRGRNGPRHSPERGRG